MKPVDRLPSVEGLNQDAEGQNKQRPWVTDCPFFPTFGLLRVLLVILGLYVSCVGAIPCTDGMHTHKEVTEISQNGNQHHKENQEDICPPFCNCNCCGCSVFSNYSFQFLTIKLFIPAELSFSDRESQFHSRNFSSVWQPPKLG